MIFAEFFGCLGRLYACEESGRTRCPDTERCLSIEPVVSEVEVTNENGNSFDLKFRNSNTGDIYSFTILQW